MIPEPNFPPNLSHRELLELQITARLLGELPAADAAALDEALRRDPELALLEARLRRSLPWIETACRHPSPADPSEEFATPASSADAKTRRAAFLTRLRQESRLSPDPLQACRPPSEPLPAPAAVPSRMLSFPSLRWLAVAASLVALFMLVSTSLRQPRELSASFELALDRSPTATSLGVPFTSTNRDLLRRRPSDSVAFGITPEETVRLSPGQPAQSAGEESLRRAAVDRFYFAENAPSTPASIPVAPEQDVHWNFSRPQGGLAGAAREVRLAETPMPSLDTGAIPLGETSQLHRAPTEPSSRSSGEVADQSFRFSRTGNQPVDAPTVPTRRTEVRGRSLPPESTVLSTLAAADKSNSTLAKETESMGFPLSSEPKPWADRERGASTSLEFQPPVLGDAVQIGSLFVQEGREVRPRVSSATALGRTLGELPELLSEVPRERPPSPLIFLPETLTADQPLSTFSLNVADVSFQLAAASLAQGQLPPPHTIRTEEFINAFHYRDPEPAPGVPVGLAWERARYPFTQQRDVLRLAVRTAAIGRHARQPLHVILLIDASGSMERADRVATLHAALQALATQLAPADRLSAVTFARTAHLVVDGASGSDAPRLVERLLQVVPEGGTHLEEALQLGYQTALRHFIPGGAHRLILFTDGAANLGELQNSELQSIVENHRRRGIALDTFGIGWEGYDDERLAALARHGDGRYGFLNSPDDVASRFIRQLTGALEVAASDVKVQVEFHPDRVASWRQVGYAQHQLTAEQFRDDTVDAAELGAAESGNALYLIETLPHGSGPIATVRVRFQQPSSGIVSEHTWAVPYTSLAPNLTDSSPALRLAVAAAGFGERLSGNPLAAGISIPVLQDLLQNVAEFYHPDPAPARLQLMLQQAAPLLSP